MCLSFTFFVLLLFHLEERMDRTNEALQKAYVISLFVLLSSRRNHRYNTRDSGNAEERYVKNSIKAKEVKALRFVCGFQWNNACFHLFLRSRVAKMKSNPSCKENKLISAVKNQ
jgi:hypothetical protein